QQLWQAALGEMQMLVPGPVYENFLRGTVGTRREEGTLTVAVPSDFVLSWLDTKLRPRLTQTVERLAGESLALQFTVLGASPLPSPESSILSSESPPAPTTLETGADSSHSAISTQHPALRLNPAYTFTSFVVGTSNHLAHAAAQSVAATPGQSYNPLFLYGGVGLGKTHLLHAIGHQALAQGLAVVYVSSEQFTNEFVNGIRAGRNEEFRARYRTPDVLLIDDIQFIAGKEQTQEEFFHTFNDLHSARHQVVITSDRAPKSISLLEDRLVSRFEWGLIADVQPPDYETRLAILRTKAEEQRVAVPGAVLDFIAQRVSENIRELEGSLNRVIAFAQLTKEELSLALAARALGEIAPAPRRRILAPEAIIDAVADYYGLAPQRMAGQARDRHLVHARHVAMYLLRTDGARPLTEIGKMLGKRDHTTVMHGTEKIERTLTTDPELRGELAAIRAQLGAG
ncbi:MAG: chromosomal replication initiator protein DnaA, partial [Dehalococcoidia bacterium]